MNRYAIHNSRVGFTLKKQGETAVYLRTPAQSSALDNIRTVFGAATARCDSRGVERRPGAPTGVC